MIRNPVGRQYKGRKYADRYAAGLQVSWGGEQSNGSKVEIVVDTIETPEGRRYQVMAVTTTAAERPATTPVSNERVAVLRIGYVGQDILLGSGEYRISGLDRRIYEPGKLDVYLEVRNAKGQVTARTWTVLSPAELAAKVL